MSRDEAHEEFIAILAHELRNPLSAVVSSVELLKLQEDRTSSLQLLAIIEDRVRAVTKILDDLLDVSVLSQTTAVLQKETYAANVLRGQKNPAAQTPLSGEATCARVLVVDDNEVAAEILSKLLEHRGHTVAVAHTGYEAIEKAHHFRPQCIILDIGLPDMDGYEVVRRLKKQKNFSSVVYIALTGYGQPQDKERAKEVGFHLHLTKPVAIRDIEVAFEQMLPLSKSDAVR